MKSSIADTLAGLLLSRVFWFNLFLFLSLGLVSLKPEATAGVFAIANVALRFVTRESLGDKGRRFGTSAGDPRAYDSTIPADEP